MAYVNKNWGQINGGNDVDTPTTTTAATTILFIALSIARVELATTVKYSLSHIAHLHGRFVAQRRQRSSRDVCTEGERESEQSGSLTLTQLRMANIAPRQKWKEEDEKNTRNISHFDSGSNRITTKSARSLSQVSSLTNVRARGLFLSVIYTWFIMAQL